MVQKFPVKNPEKLILNISGNNCSKIWVFLVRLSSFPEIPETYVSLTTRNFWNLKQEFWVE